MTTVYVVTSGSYSDYGIDCVFLDKEKAEKYIAHEKQQGHQINDLEEYESMDDKVLPELNLYYRAFVEVNFASEIPSNKGEKYYKFGEIKDLKPRYAPSKEEAFDWGDDSWDRVRQHLTSPSLTYPITITGISDRSQEVVRKIIQDRIAQAIEIIERVGFIPARD